MDLNVIGMISGTSYDAVDAAAAALSLDPDGNVVLRPLGLHSVPMPESLRGRLADCLPPASTTLDEVCRLDTELGQLFGTVAAETDARFTGGSADLVVSHGQTVYHWVEGRRALGTLQLGAAAWVASATGHPVVSDLRTRDLTVGGHGAPLASTLDALLLLADDARRGALNLGGIANITLRGPDGNVLAYDIGPASALMDRAVAELSAGAQRMDVDGTMAGRGQVDERLLAALLDEPYYRLPAPKSTGKELFHADYVRQRLGAAALTPDDLLATLTELTARLVADACRQHDLEELVVAGGGYRNPVLMARIRSLAAPTSVSSIEDWGLPAQGKEAYLFALLGYLSVHGLAGTIPSATGASVGSVLGSFTPGGGPLQLPDRVTEPPRRLRVVTG